MEFKGSFGTVKVVDGYVCKREALYDKDGDIELSSMTECALTALVNMMKCDHLPLVEDIRVENGDVVLRMPYYGRTLSSWVHDTPRAKKMQTLPHLLRQLVQACEVLLKNDVQHTDIKPMNILIGESDDRLVLIDFNIYSVKTMSGWVETVGTWCYLAPEILLGGIPCDSSMSWSIGVILAECIAGYPLGKIEKLVMDINSRREWQSLMSKLKIGFHGLPLIPKYYDSIPTQYVELYNMCTLWDTTQRAPLSRIAEYLDTKFAATAPAPVPVPAPATVTLKVLPFNNDLRDSMIDRIFTFCTLRSYFWNLLYRSIWLYDTFASNDLLDVATCICVVHIFIGYTVRNKFLKNLSIVFNLPDLTLEDIEKRMIVLCSRVGWKIYDKGADVLAIEQYHSINSRSIVYSLPAIMKARTTEYDGYDIADAIIKHHQVR
jgi:serine/threonine protein kinase